MSAEENKALALRAWEVVFNQRNLDALSEFYAVDAVWHQPNQNLQGLEEVKQWLSRPFEAFPDLNVSVEDVIAEGDKVVIRYTLAAPTRERRRDLVLPPGDGWSLKA
jgi:predicted ester cyclase